MCQMRQVQECQSGQECTAPSKPRTFSLPGIPGSPPRPPSRSVGCGRGSRRMHYSVGHAQTLSHPHREPDDLSTAQYSWKFYALQQCAAIRQSKILPTGESQATILVLRWLATREHGLSKPSARILRLRRGQLGGLHRPRGGQAETGHGV